MGAAHATLVDPEFLAPNQEKTRNITSCSHPENMAGKQASLDSQWQREIL
jgi:hypothetical protein